MIVIEDFLDKEVCTYCIKYFKENISDAIYFQKRMKLGLFNCKEDDTIKKLVDKYSKIYPGHYLKNIEISEWPVGESHKWHRDNQFYDKTTITYLNDNYKGGVNFVKNFKSEPKTGKIILFNSEDIHMASMLEEGVRYVILAWFNILK
tara:strand:+ start:146 stop:589 length:444 start_codon:yes stop_codon:yes gene_type:complete